jgi:membrane protease YdiL (CAAX protease family)
MGYGVAPPAERSPGWQLARVFFLAMGGFIAFLIVAVAYAAITDQSTGAPSQGSSLWLIPVGFFVSAAAGFGEEMLITGMVVTTLEQAGFAKRAWVIYLVAICLRIPFHLYYGWAAVGVICFTVVNIWIYRRWRLLWPIVLAHAAYDLVQSLSQTIPGNAAGLPIVGLGLVTIVMVIVIACIEGSDASARRRYKAFIAHRTGMAGLPSPYGQPAQPPIPQSPIPQPPIPQFPVAASPPVPPTPPQAQPLMQFPDAVAQQPSLMQFPETPQPPSLLQLTETPPVPPAPQASELQPPQPPQFPNF